MVTVKVVSVMRRKLLLKVHLGAPAVSSWQGKMVEHLSENGRAQFGWYEQAREQLTNMRDDDL